MATRITATELSRNLSDILSRVAYRGEEFLVERNGEAIAEITPATLTRGAPVSVIIERIGHLKVPKGFGADLVEIHAEQGEVPSSPWDE